MKTKIERYLRQLAPHMQEREGPQLLREAVKEIDSLQSKIDALMMEYCPDEMTLVQVANWWDHQVVAPDQVTPKQERDSQ